MIRAKNYETVSTFVKVMPRILWPLFSLHGVYDGKETQLKTESWIISRLPHVARWREWVRYVVSNCDRGMGRGHRIFFYFGVSKCVFWCILRPNWVFASAL